MRLEAALDRRANHLTLIRVLAAVAVLVSHSWTLTLGPGTPEPLSGLFGMSLGSVSVLVFFGISGVLIPMSLERAETLAIWARARILRIFPALFCVALLTALVLGPLVTTEEIGAYFGSTAPVRYVLNVATLAKVNTALPGVFEAATPAPHVNGSLWTLPYEVGCYLLVALLGTAGIFRRQTGVLAVAALLAVTAFAVWQRKALGLSYTSLGHFLNFALPFLTGTLFYLLRRRILLNWKPALVLLGLTLAALGTDFLRPMLSVTLVYWVLWIGLVPQGPLLAYNRLGDYSYGTYIYAFPIQQTVAQVMPGISPVAAIAVALPITLCFAVLSWLLVERPALRLKRRHAPALAAPVTTAG